MIYLIVCFGYLITSILNHLSLLVTQHLATQGGLLEVWLIQVIFTEQLEKANPLLVAKVVEVNSIASPH